MLISPGRGSNVCAQREGGISISPLSQNAMVSVGDLNLRPRATWVMAGAGGGRVLTSEVDLSHNLRTYSGPFHGMHIIPDSL